MAKQTPGSELWCNECRRAAAFYFQAQTSRVWRLYAQGERIASAAERKKPGQQI